MNIKEIALKIARSMADFPIEHEPYEYQIKFAEAVVAELAKGNTPTLALFQHDETGRTTSVEPNLADDFERMNKRWYRVGNLYTLPPTAEQIEQETAEAIAHWIRCGDHHGVITSDDVLASKWREFL